MSDRLSRTDDADEVSLEFGYTPELKRTLGGFQVFAVSFAFISVAVGIFGTYGLLLTSAGPVGIWTWLIALAGQLLVALVIAQFAARIPLSGSSYQWASRLTNPRVGWGFGWLTFCYLVTGLVAIDNAMASQCLMPLFGMAPDCKRAGFEALATSSAAFAATLGRRDGRHSVSATEHLAHAKLIVELSDLPVNGDFEDGYGETPDDVAATIESCIGVGLAGVGVEDSSGDPDNPIRDFDDAIRRLTAFAEVGADVLYAPFPPDMAAVEAIVRAVAPKPVNLVVGTMSERPPASTWAAVGVKRISTGMALYAHLAATLQKAVTVLSEGDIAGATKGITFAELNDLLDSAHRG